MKKPIEIDNLPVSMDKYRGKVLYALLGFNNELLLYKSDKLDKTLKNLKEEAIRKGFNPSVLLERFESLSKECPVSEGGVLSIPEYLFRFMKGEGDLRIINEKDHFILTKHKPEYSLKK